MPVFLCGPPARLACLALIVMVIVPNSFAEGESRFEFVEKLLIKASNQLAETKECSSLDAPKGCTISEGCTHIECKRTFAGKSIVVTITINRCEEPETVTVKLDVPEDDISWSETYSTGKAVAVPGFSVSTGITSAGVYLRVDMNPGTDHALVLKVTLLAGAKLGDSVEVFPVKMTIVSQALPLSSEHCAFVRWWRTRNMAECVVIAIAFVVFMIVLFTGCFCCCCCCCRSCRKRRNGII